MWQATPVLSAPGQSVLGIRKLASTCKDAIVSGALPLLLTVTDWAALTWPISNGANARLDVLRSAVDCNPTPLNGMACGLPAASSLMVNVPFLAPRAAGAKDTLIRQLVPMATPVPQVLV